MVTEETLLQGAWYALEQAGRLLRNAALIADNEDPITGSVLAMFGREELGRSQILRNLAERVKVGETLEPSQIKNACDSHSTKQTAGTFSTSLRTIEPSRLSDALSKRMICEPGTPEWDSSNQVIDAGIKAKQKNDPQRRHRMRTDSLYVDLMVNGLGWNRPCTLDKTEAVNEINEAVNDYALERDRLRPEVLLANYPEMAEALESMEVKVELPEPRWSILP